MDKRRKLPSGHSMQCQYMLCGGCSQSSLPEPAGAMGNWRDPIQCGNATWRSQPVGSSLLLVPGAPSSGLGLTSPPSSCRGFLTPLKAVGAAADTDISQPHHCRPQLRPIIVSILIPASMGAHGCLGFPMAGWKLRQLF